MIKDHHYEAGLDLRRSMFGSALAEQQVENTTELTDKMQEIVTRWCFGICGSGAGSMPRRGV